MPEITPAEMLIIEVLRFLLPVCISLYALFSGRSREERKLHDAQIKELLLAKENQQERLKGFQLEMERMADEMLRKHQEHESKLSEVGRLREDMASVKAEVKHIVEGFNRLESKLDKLIEQRYK